MSAQLATFLSLWRPDNAAQVIHAEMPATGKGLPPPRGLQLWVDLPKQYKMADPSYQELKSKE